MLEKLNNLYNNLIYEQAEDIWLRKITNDNDFYKVYLYPLIEKNNVDIVKSRMNTFRIIGLYKNVLDCLNEFKVNEDYWNEKAMGKKFVVYSPIITFGEVIHKMNFDEGYPVGTVESNSLYAYRNFERFEFEGRWYEPKELDSNNEFTYPVRCKQCTPKELCKMIENLKEELGKPDNCCVVVEFTLNCENLANQVYDEQTQFIPVELEDEKTLSNEINDIESKDVIPTAKCELPKENTENKVKTLKPKKSGKPEFSTPVINTYDKKNKFKKTTKKLKI